MVSIPKLSDVRSQPGRFQPGDRILARVSSHLQKDQSRKLVRAIEKFAGCELRVLVVNFLAIEIWRITEGRQTLLVGPEIMPQDSLQLGVMNLNCSRIDLLPGDVLAIRSKRLTDLQKRVLKQHVQAWAGPEVEVLND